MGRIIGVDFGLKRSGISVTDPQQIIVTALESVETKDLLAFLRNYFSHEVVLKLVIGLPTHRDGNFTSIKPEMDRLVSQLRKEFPHLEVDFQDESFSSFEAKQIILDSGVKKKKRRDKGLVDKVSAVLILQRYLKHI